MSHDTTRTSAEGRSVSGMQAGPFADRAEAERCVVAFASRGIVAVIQEN